jgi:hypothetical protein
MFFITLNWCHFAPRTDVISAKMPAAMQTSNTSFMSTVGAAILFNLRSGYPSLICNPVMHHVTAESWLQKKEEAHEALKNMDWIARC